MNDLKSLKIAFLKDYLIMMDLLNKSITYEDQKKRVKVTEGIWKLISSLKHPPSKEKEMSNRMTWTSLHHFKEFIDLKKRLNPNDIVKSSLEELINGKI